jgi:tetraacyldisaccharide-1-P 4'-kinase
LITTAKDGVKLRSLSFSLPWRVFEIQIAIEDEQALRQLVLQAQATEKHKRHHAS